MVRPSSSASRLVARAESGTATASPTVTIPASGSSRLNGLSTVGDRVAPRVHGDCFGESRDAPVGDERFSLLDVRGARPGWTRAFGWLEIAIVDGAEEAGGLVFGAHPLQVGDQLAFDAPNVARTSLRVPALEIGVESVRQHLRTR